MINGKHIFITTPSHSSTLGTLLLFLLNHHQLNTHFENTVTVLQNSKQQQKTKYQEIVI